MPARGHDSVFRVAKQLEGAGLDFEADAVVGGLRCDFLVHIGERSDVVVEVKSWSARDGNVARAWDQVEYLRSMPSINDAYVVIDDMQREYPTKGVVTANRLIDILLKLRSERAPSHESRRTDLGRDEPLPVFVAMPFDRKYDDTYFVAIAQAARDVGAVCDRIDEEEFGGRIDVEIERRIRRARAVVADVSGANPNVLYELGFARAMEKPCVQVCSTRLTDLPFDIRNFNTLAYQLGQTHKLRDSLSRRLLSVIEDGTT